MAMISGFIVSMLIEDPCLNFQVKVGVKYTGYILDSVSYTDPIRCQILDFQSPVR